MGLMSRTLTAALLCAALLSAALAAADSSPSSSLPDVLQSLGVTDAPPFPCSYQAPDGKYFDFSSMTTATGTQVPGVSSTEVYMINVCGATSTTDRQRARQEKRQSAGRLRDGGAPGLTVPSLCSGCGLWLLSS